MNPGDPGNPGRGPMWSLHIPTTGPLAGIRLLCASPQGGISPAPLRTDRRDQLCVPTPISWMKLLQRATTQVSSRNQFPSRNPRSYSLGVRAYMPSRLHKTSMKLHASLQITQDHPHLFCPCWGHRLLCGEGGRVLVWSPDASGAGEPRLPGAARRGEPPRPA